MRNSLPRPSRPPHRPVVTLTTDFGTADTYVAAMKGAVLARCRDAALVDITHAISPQDIAGGSIALERAVAAFPSRTVHLAVVDPGVGTERRILVVRLNRSLIICPDNGLITWAIRRHSGAAFFELQWRPPHASHTFHGRDIMAPAAAMLATGRPPSRLATPVNDPQLLDLHLAPPNASTGEIIHIDHYGNATTNIPASHLRDFQGTITVAGQAIGPVRRTYADVPSGEPIALVGSSDLLEIAVRNGSARALLGLRVGDPIEFH